MGLDDVLDDAHPQSDAADGSVGRIDAIKLVEDPRHLFRGHADSLVADGQAVFAVDPPSHDLDRPPAGRILDGVAEKILQDLPDLAAVDRNFGPGVAEVSCVTADGKIVISRADGRNATLSRPGEPDRFVALHRRDTDELLAEELRRLDPDEVYGEALAAAAAATGQDAQKEQSP